MPTSTPHSPLWLVPEKMVIASGVLSSEAIEYLIQADQIDVYSRKIDGNDSSDRFINLCDVMSALVVPPAIESIESQTISDVAETLQITCIHTLAFNMAQVLRQNSKLFHEVLSHAAPNDSGIFNNTAKCRAAVDSEMLRGQEKSKDRVLALLIAICRNEINKRTQPNPMEN